MEHTKKILLRITALVLAAVLTVGVLPSASAAPTNAEAALDDLAYSFEGENPLGNLIAGTLSEETEEMTEDINGYNVTGLRIEGATATVDYEVLEAACLVVALYSEDGMQLLASAKADVTAEETEAVVTFGEELPDYFLAEAYLLDSYDYSPLCTPYETARYTREIQELIASDIHDYDAELVLNLDDREDSNFAVYHETTIRIEERDGVNLVTTLDYENNVFVIENADEQFTSLTEGDVISYFYDGGSMLLARVAEIEIDGTTVTIHGGDLQMEEVFSHLKIEGESDPDTVEADPSDLDDGVEYVGPCDMTPYGSSGAYETHDLSGSGSVSKGFEHTLKEKKYCGGKVTLSGKVKVGISATLDFYIAGDRTEVEFVIKPSFEFKLSVMAKGDASEFLVTLAKIIIPLIPGVVDAAVIPSLKLEFTASITFTASAYFKVGLSVTKKGVFKKPKIKNLSQKPNFEMDVKVEGKIFLGVKMSPTVLIGAGAASTDVSYEGGVELVGTLIEVKDDGLYHYCSGMCITGKSYIRHAVTCEGKFLKWKVKKTLAEKRIRFKNLDFYLCGLHAEAGFGECPNVMRKITVTVEDENGEGVENAAVYSNEAGLLISDEYTNSKGVAVLYLPKGEHNIRVQKESLTADKTVKVSGDQKKVTIKLKPDKPEEEEEEEKNDALDDSSGDELVDYGVVQSSGAFSETLKWTFYDSGLLLIEGEGIMDSFYYESPPWEAIEDQVTSLIVREGVTTIGDAAFGDMDNLAQVTLMEGVTAIGRSAFSSCDDLKEVTLPDSLVGIEEYAFSGCMNLEQLTIGSGLEYVEEDAFYREDYYVNKDKHMSINIDSVEHWMTIDFENYSARPNCNRRFYLNFEDSFPGTVTIPDSITEVDEEVFAYCDSITKLVVPDHVTYIGDKAFYDCDGLETMVFGDGLTRIGAEAFAECSSVDAVYLGNGLRYVEENAFDYSKSSGPDVHVPTLQDWLDIDFENPGANPIRSETFKGSFGIIYYGAQLFIGGSEDYLTELVIPEGTEIKNKYSFAGYNWLTSATLPEGLTAIPEGMFYSCFYMEHISIPDSLTAIGPHAFNGCNFLRECILPDGVNSIGSYAFAGCRYLRHFTIPAGLTRLADSLFHGNTYFEEITIPENITSIGDYVFAECDSLTTVSIPDSVARIGANAFTDCDELTTVELPACLTTIEDETFYNCQSLGNVTIPDGVTRIGARAFLDCASMTSVTIPASVRSIGEDAFSSLFIDVDLAEVYFCGDAPSTEPDIFGNGGWVFQGITATIYYPAGNPTWTQEAMGALALPSEYEDRGKLTWVPYTPGGSNGIRSELTTLAAPEKPSVGTDAIYSGEYGSGEMAGVTVKTADFEGLVPGAEYVLLVLASLEPEDRLAADNLLYIGHAAAAEEGTASFTYIPTEFRDRSIVVLCGPSNKDLNDAVITLPLMGADGETWTVEPTVVYDGVTLIEGKDYELTGAVSYREEGTYTLQIHGIHNYTGVVEVTYSVADHVHEFGPHIPDCNATCLTDGTKTAKCMYCDLTETLPDEGSVLGHDWDEGVVTIEPTEETEGESFHTCLRCGETKTEVLPKKEHVHEYELVWEIPGNCQLGGSKIYQCRTCGDSYETERGEPEPHPWDEGVVIKEPTEETEGEMLYSCTYCSKTKTEPIPRIHDCMLEFVETIAPTCTERGYSIFACTYCGEEALDDYVDALGHSWDNGVVTKEPTYEEEGEELYTCTVCGHTTTITLPRLHDHSYYVVEVVEPTCISDGYTVYRCEVCGEAHYDDFVPVTDHIWDEGVVTVEPTEETVGERLFTCTYCGETRTEVLPKLHTHAYAVLRVVQPDCINRGYTLYLCSGCGDVCFDDYVDALGHSFGGWTPAGDGMEERVCERCGYTEQRTVGSPENPFADVLPGSFYYESVMWAVENGITNGTSATTFGPSDQCMRAHVVTFLWRAVGSPEPTRTDNPFVDVKPGDFYYKSVLWALENGITSGMDATHFGPTAYCNRAQVVTFLYRTMGSPELESMDHPFTDVQSGVFYEKPVLWAVQNGITNGLSATAFGPGSICNRAQIVTFLYRAFVD